MSTIPYGSVGPQQAKRDPLTDPQVGDRVQAQWIRAHIHTGEAAVLTVEARTGNLIATSSTASDAGIEWIHVRDWCKSNMWVSHWKVIE